jgi:hypothetical protein
MFVIGSRMTTIQVFLPVLILILDEAAQAIVKIFLSLLIAIGSIPIMLPSPFDLEAGIPLPNLLQIGIIINIIIQQQQSRRRRTST